MSGNSHTRLENLMDGENPLELEKLKREMAVQARDTAELLIRPSLF